MFNEFFEKIKNIFKNLEEKTLKIMKNGLIFSFITLIIGIVTLTTYILFIHNYLIYKIGLLIFEISLYFAADFIISGIAVDSIKKQII